MLIRFSDLMSTSFLETKLGKVLFLHEMHSCGQDRKGLSDYLAITATSLPCQVPSMAAETELFSPETFGVNHDVAFFPDQRSVLVFLLSHLCVEMVAQKSISTAFCNSYLVL